MEPNEQLPTNQVSLDDLKRAVDDYENLKDDDIRSASVRLADAWRMAFEWHAGLGARHAGNLRDGLGELADGMRLIREKLR